MSKTGVLIATVLALLLGIAVLLTDRSPGVQNPVGSGPLLGSLDIGSVERIRVQAGNGTAELHRLKELPEMWVLNAPGASPWPANGRSVFATLRLLAGLTIDPSQAATPGGYTTLSLFSKNNAELQLRIAQSAVAGRTLVALADGRAALAPDDGLAQAFGSGDFSAWRILELFPLDGAGASRITIEEGGKKLTLARIGRSWSLTTPVAAKADEPIVTTVLSKLAQSSAKKFSNVGPDSAAFEKPVVKFTIETDRQGGDSESSRRTVVQEVCVGPAADIGGGAVSCRIRAWAQDGAGHAREELWGPVVVAVDRGVLAGLAVNSEAYLSRVAIDAAGPDVGRVRMLLLETSHGELDVAREGDGWKNADGAPVAKEAVSTLTALVKFLTEERAKSIVTNAGALFTPIADVKVSKAGGALIGGCEIGRYRADTNSPTVIGIRAGGVVRLYDRPADQLVHMLGYE